MTTTLWFVLAFLLSSSFVLRAATNAARTKAKFKLFAVRDKLIFLVASGALAEDHPVFKYYYNRLNALLQTAPRVGFDDFLLVLFCFQGNSNFEDALRQSRSEVEVLLEDPAMQLRSVRTAVAEFYRAISFLMFTHSNVVRLAYYLVRFLGEETVEKHLLPKIASSTAANSPAIEAANTVTRFVQRLLVSIKAFRFAQQEASQVSHGLCNSVS